MPSRLLYENAESSSFKMASKIFLKMNLGKCRAFPDNEQSHSAPIMPDISEGEEADSASIDAINNAFFHK